MYAPISGEAGLEQYFNRIVVIDSAKSFVPGMIVNNEVANDVWIFNPETTYYTQSYKLVTTKDIDKFLEAIEYISINYSCIHSPIYSKRDDIIKLVIDMDGPEGSKAEQSYNLMEGKFSWRYADIETVLKTYPLQPTMNIKINKGEFSIPRIVDFDLSLEMELETDGTIELTGGK